MVLHATSQGVEDSRPNMDVGGQSRNVCPYLINAADAAEFLGVSKAQFYRKHKAGLIPLPLRLGGSVRWRVNELKAWVDAGMPNRQTWLTMNGGGA